MKAKLNSQGRLVIPAACREAAGIAPGAEVLIEVAGPGELRVTTKAHAIRKAQTIVAGRRRKGRDLVAELLRERRKAAARE